jgi:succinate dehydrogenase / fumarate reductase flavoprotein subunit
LDFSEAINRLGESAVRERYGNLFAIYHEITNENAYRTPMRIYPAVHYTMGGLWVDYNLMSNVPGLFVLGEANFSDHGANRLGASALMQGLADGYFVVPYTIGDYLATQKPGSRPSPDGPEFREAEANVRGMNQRLLGANGSQPVSHFHKRLGHIMWQYCGMSRTREGLQQALRELATLREEFWATVKVPGSADTLNQSLEKAGRVADFIELGELMCLDALTREESCGGHFREEHQYPDGECKRDDERFAHVAAWEYQGAGKEPLRNVEPLNYEFVKMSLRNYK